MKLRIARKIARAAYRTGGILHRYSRDQMRRAFLRVLRRPMLITSRSIDLVNGHYPTWARPVVVISPRCVVVQPARPHDWVSQGSRIVFVPR